MSSMLRPVGPEQNRTYWRRRLVVVLVLVALVVAVVAGVRALTGGSQEASASNRLDTDQVGVPVSSTSGAASTTSGTPTGSGTASSGTASSSTSAGAACDDGDIDLALTSTASAYGPGRSPKFVLTATNTSDTACTLRTGNATVDFRAASGSSTVWSSADCRSGAEPAESTVEAGSRKLVASITWSRLSSASGCPTNQQPVPDGTYTITAEWQDRSPDPLTVSFSG